MKINWFGPLPPAKTGIADFVAMILPQLMARSELTLWTDQKKWDPSIAKQANLRVYRLEQMPWDELNRGDLNIYNLGNNHIFHGSIWQVARQQPGVVILHDLRLNDFFYNLYRDHFHTPTSFLAHMQNYYGSEGYRAAEQSLASGSVEGLTQRYPLTALALENSLGVLVHTRESYEELTHDSRQLVAYAPLPFSSTPAAEVVRKTQGDDHPYRLILFGFINRNRQLEQLLESLARFPQKNRFALDIYGDVWDSGHVRSQIKKLGLSSVVTLRGFASQEVLDAALDSADLAINLRYPTMGEASISQLRIWAHSLPSLVTSVGWYGDLPDTVVAHVRPGHEQEDIHAHLNAFLTDHARFKKMGEEGRRLLEEQHQPETYVATLFELVAQALLFRPRAVAYNLADRVGTQMNAWADALSSDQALKKAAEEILALTRGPAA